MLVIADLGMSYNSSTTMQHVYVRAPAWLLENLHVTACAGQLRLYRRPHSSSGSFYC